MDIVSKKYGGKSVVVLAHERRLLILGGRSGVGSPVETVKKCYLENITKIIGGYPG